MLSSSLQRTDEKAKKRRLGDIINEYWTTELENLLNDKGNQEKKQQYDYDYC